MRSHSLHILPILAAALAAQAIHADEERGIAVGELVLPITQDAVMRSAPSDTAGIVAWYPGTFSLTVTEVNHAWLRTDRGWVKRSGVVPCDRAIVFFTRQLCQSRSVFALCSRAGARLSAEQYQAALDDANEAVSLDRTDPLGFFIRGSAAASTGDVDSAFADFGRAIALKGDFAEAFLARGAMRFSHGDFPSAIADYGDAIRLDANWAYPYLTRAHAHLEMRAYDAAVADFTESIRRNDFDREAYIGRATAHHAFGKRLEAMLDIDEFIKRSPKQADGYIFRAVLWRTRGENSKPTTDLQTALALAPERDDAYFLRAVIAYQDDAYRIAIDDLERVARANPRHADAHALLAWIRATCPDASFRDGRIAIESATVACKLSHFRNARHIAALAAAHAEANDFRSAVKWQLEVVKMLGRADPAGQRSSGDSALSIVLKTPGRDKRTEEEGRLKAYRDGKPYREAAANAQGR